MIKKECIKEMFVKHFKSTLGPQDTDNEPHPAIAHMYSVHITETAFKMIDEVDEDLWIGDSGASSHLIGSEKDVFDKKMIEASVNTANSEKMKIKCEGKVNVSHFTKTGYKSKGTLSVKVVEGLKLKLFSFSTSLSKGWIMNGYKQKNGDIVIMLTHDKYPAIIFDQMIKCGSSVLMGAKNENSKCFARIYLAQEREKSFHQKTRHTMNAYLQDTAKYYGIELSGTIPNCVSCSIEKIRQKNIPKENANQSTIPGD